MKTETYQTSPKGRSTKADKAGLSLPKTHYKQITLIYTNKLAFLTTVGL